MSSTVTRCTAVVLFFGVTAYALFGGADFGAGFWDLIAGGAERGERPRALIDHSIGPVWEANHVWLIFSLVVLWTGVLGCVRVDHAHAVRAAHAGRARDRVARIELRVPQGRAPYPRPSQLRCRVRGIVGARPVLHGRGRGRHRFRTGPVGRQGRRPVVELDQPHVDHRRASSRSRCARTSSAVYLVWDARRLENAELAEYFRRRAIGAAVVAGVDRVRRDHRLPQRRELPLRRPHLTCAPARHRRRRCAASARSSCWCATRPAVHESCPSARSRPSWSAGASRNGPTCCPTSTEGLAGGRTVRDARRDPRRLRRRRRSSSCRRSACSTRSTRRACSRAKVSATPPARPRVREESSWTSQVVCSSISGRIRARSSRWTTTQS